MRPLNQDKTFQPRDHLQVGVVLHLQLVLAQLEEFGHLAEVQGVAEGRELAARLQGGADLQQRVFFQVPLFRLRQV